ncbi:MAG: PAS domain-containing protein [Gammaproteobacteria bacterium]|nr:MAG: PAS domain-containing protein [Gammaproteobacteria bacterium]
MNQAVSLMKQPEQALRDPQGLLAAFEHFSQLSAQLQQSYQQLDQRATELTQELAIARSERLQQLAEKEKLAERLEKLLAALPAGVVVVDTQGRIVTANRAAEMLFGNTLQGQIWQTLFTQQLQHQDGQDVVLKNGRILSINHQQLDNNEGEIILLNDVTHNRKLQAIAGRQQRLAAMGQMAAGLAHQLRTPLASALLYTSQIEKAEQQPEIRNRALSKILASLRYLQKLINDMLMYAKGGEFSHAAFSVAQLLVAFKSRIEPRLQQSNTRLSIQCNLHQKQIRGSMDALVSVLMNLAENAMDVCTVDCAIELHVYQQADYLIFAMRDNGPGISAEQQLHIFEAFYTAREGGTGLGLAVAQSIAQAHQGDLLVKSDIGKGSTFYLCLPLDQGEHFLPSGKMTIPSTSPGNMWR